MIIISIKSTEVFSSVCKLQLLPTVKMPKREREEENNFAEERSGKMGNHKVPFICAHNKPKTACFIIASIKSNKWQ